MIQRIANPVGQQLEVLWTAGTLTGLSDAQLVGRFAGLRDATAELAFRELMNRHGPMVMGVCRQILRRPHDADDAFQATFLVLVRKGGSIRVGESLAPWLYAVAYRTAHRARAVASRYRPVPAEILEIPAESSPNDPCHFDLRPLLLEELNRLPGKYRDPIVLCHLEGKTHEEAARLLHWPVGTLSGRLSRGRELLQVAAQTARDRGLTGGARLELAGRHTNRRRALIHSSHSRPRPLAWRRRRFLHRSKPWLRGYRNPCCTASCITPLLSSPWWEEWSPAPPSGEFRPLEATKPPAQGDRPNARQQVAQPKASSQKPASGPQAVTTAEPGNVPVRPGHKKNSPRFPGVRTSSMVLVESPDRTAWQAYSLVKEHPMAGSLDKVHPGWMTIRTASRNDSKTDLAQW